MLLLDHDKVKVDKQTEFERFVFDGKAGTGNNQAMINIAVYTVKGGDEIVIVDEFFAGFDYSGANLKTANIGLNVWTGNKAPSDLVDGEVPDFPNSIPFGFNLGINTTSPRISDSYIHKPWAWAKVGQTLQVCLNISSGTALPGPFTINFRKRVLNAYV